MDRPHRRSAARKAGGWERVGGGRECSQRADALGGGQGEGVGVAMADEMAAIAAMAAMAVLAFGRSQCWRCWRCRVQRGAAARGGQMGPRGRPRPA